MTKADKRKKVFFFHLIFFHSYYSTSLNMWTISSSASSSVLLLSLLLLLVVLVHVTTAFHIVIPGGTGPIGQALANALPQHEITILCRNAFLASTPSRVSEDFGWVGESYLKKNPHVHLRDWDGGDLLDIVGQDWIGWQDDTLTKADIVINLCGGYTQQRIMATERIVRESLRVNPNALQIIVKPATDEDLNAISPGAISMKNERIQTCETMVTTNCANTICIPLETYRLEQNINKLVQVIEEYKK